MSKKKLQDLRKIILAEMDKQKLSRADVVRLLQKRKLQLCGRNNFYKFMAGSQLGHEKIAEVFGVLNIKVETGD